MEFMIAVLSGAAMSVQGVLNTQTTKQTGIWVANAFIQGSAFLVCLVIWFMSDRAPFGKLIQVTPRYMLLGGVIGVFITYSVICAMDSLGPAKAVMVIVISQLAAAYLIELYGIFGVEKEPFMWRKVLGLIAAIIGFIIFKWE